MDATDLLVIGCGPAGGIAAREAARAGVETLVLERDPVVGARRVCAAGLRPGFCELFDLPRSIVHLDPPTIALHSPRGRRYEFTVGPSHTTTREELDGTIGALAAQAGARIRTGALWRGLRREGATVVAEYADARTGTRETVRARSVFIAAGASAQLEREPRFAYRHWPRGLIACYQYRVYPERPADPVAYATLEMHYYTGREGRPVIAWMFPKRDHLAVGLGIAGKVAGAALRAELEAFLETVRARLFPGVAYTVKPEGNVLYGGLPRPRIADEQVLVGGSAAGLVDATTGEGIHEAAMTGRLAAESAAAMRRGASRRTAAEVYERGVRRMFYGRLRHRHKLMSFLERRPARFDVLFEQLARTPRFAELLQHDRNDFTAAEWLYLYGQAAAFSVRALRAS